MRNESTGRTTGTADPSRSAVPGDAPDAVVRGQRTHAVLHADQGADVAERGDAVGDGVEPFGPAGRGTVCGHVETSGIVLPEADVVGRQDDDDLGVGQRLGEVVDRMGQDGQPVEQHELLGQVVSHARAAAASHDDDTYVRCYAFHISFFPNPSVLSVNLM